MFHGSIFSVITHQQFVTLVRKSIGDSYGNEEKLMDLLQRIQLEKRAIYDIYKADKILAQQINYDEVDTYLHDERIKAKNYLFEQLNKK